MSSPPLVGSEIVVDVDWRFAECSRACRQMAKHKPTRHWPVALLKVVLVALVILVLLALAGSVVQGGVPFDILVGALLILSWLIILDGSTSWMAAWQTRRNNPHLLSGAHHVLSSDGYRVHCGGVDSTFTWAGLLRLVETSEFFLAYPLKNAAIYLPKRCLTGLQISEVSALMEAQAPAKCAWLAA